MQALFGDGLHPDAEAAIRAAIAGEASPEDAVQASRLGRRFPRIQPKQDGWDDAIADAYQVFEAENERRPEAGVERDLIRWNIAAARIAATLQRPGTDAEVATHLSQMGKAARQPVAGYDLVFTPVKSVSVLCALGDQPPPRRSARHTMRRGRPRSPASKPKPASPGSVPVVSPRSTRTGSLPPRSSTVIPVPATRTCTPMGPCPRRCRAWTGSGGRWTVVCCTRSVWPRPNGTTP